MAAVMLSTPRDAHNGAKADAYSIECSLKGVRVAPLQGALAMEVLG